MRRQQDLGQAQKRVVGRERLGCEDVEGCPRQAPGCEGLDQRRLVDDRARATLMSTAEGFIRARRRRSISPRVSSVRGQARTTMSLSARRVSRSRAWAGGGRGRPERLVANTLRPRPVAIAARA
jgi:hypothetical protein